MTASDKPSAHIKKQETDAYATDKFGNTPPLDKKTDPDNHTEIAKRSIEVEANVNTIDKDGYAPLHWACRKGYDEIVKLLIGQKANVDAVGKYEYTPLHLACLKGDTQTAKLLIERGANVDVADEHGYTPLYLAYRNGYAETVKLLLIALIAQKASIDAADKQYAPILHWACRNGYAEIVKILIAQKASIDEADKDGYTPLYWAYRGSYAEIVKLLIEQRASIDAAGKYTTPLHLACLEGDIKNVKLLIDQGAKVVNAADKYGYTPLHWACQNGYHEIVKLLIGKGADVDVIGRYDRTPLLLASIRGDIETGKLLISNLSLRNLAAEEKPRFLCEDLSSHWDACKKNKIDSIEKLLVNYLNHLKSLHLDDKVRKKMDLTNKLLKDLEVNIESFLTTIEYSSAKKTLSEHRNNIGIRILGALYRIVTLGLASWSLPVSRGAQLHSRISDYSAAFFSSVQQARHHSAHENHKKFWPPCPKN